MCAKKRFKIMVVEDNPYYNRILVKRLQTICKSFNYPNIDFQIESYLSAQECLDHLDSHVQVIFLDFYLERYGGLQYTGLDVMEEIRHKCPDCKVVIISEQNDSFLTLELFRQGIYSYIDKNKETTNRVGLIIQDLLHDHDRLHEDVA